MSVLEPEQDFDHLKAEFDHLVGELGRLRRERTASAEYAVRLEDALFGLAGPAVRALELVDAGELRDELTSAIADACRVLPALPLDRSGA